MADDSKRSAGPRSPAELERLLGEAKKVRGNSLWKDAMRRFKRNRVSRWSMWFVAFVAVVCFITPLLPIAPHTRVTLGEQYLAPFAEPLTEQGSFFRESWPLSAPREKLEGEARQTEFDRQVDEYCDSVSWLASPLVRLRYTIFGGWETTPWMGTDKLGRCIMARVLWGGRVSLMVGLVATLVSLLIGVAYGALSGYIGGRTDNLMMRIVDVLYSIPFIFVVIFIITIVRELQNRGELSINRMLVFFTIIGAIYWLTMARVVRGQVLSIKHKEFVEASRVFGGRTKHVIWRHILPNVFSVVLVYLTLTIPRVMLFEAFLSFLGLGVEPPDVSWGMLAADGLGAINALRVYWWFVVFPSLALGSTLLALNFLGDGLRDALDPRLKDS